MILVYASATRVENKWAEADQPDVQKAHVVQQMGFGFGEHRFFGYGLVRIEIMALLQALPSRVERLEANEVEWARNNVLHAIARCEMTLH